MLFSLDNHVRGWRARILVELLVDADFGLADLKLPDGGKRVIFCFTQLDCRFLLNSPLLFSLIL